MRVKSKVEEEEGGQEARRRPGEGQEARRRLLNTRKRPERGEGDMSDIRSLCRKVMYHGKRPRTHGRTHGRTHARTED